MPEGQLTSCVDRLVQLGTDLLTAGCRSAGSAAAVVGGHLVLGVRVPPLEPDLRSHGAALTRLQAGHRRPPTDALGCVVDL